MQNKQDKGVASKGALSALGLDVDVSEDRKATQVDSIKQAAQVEQDLMREAVEEADAQVAKDVAQEVHEAQESREERDGREERQGRDGREVPAADKTAKPASAKAANADSAPAGATPTPTSAKAVNAAPTQAAAKTSEAAPTTPPASNPNKLGKRTILSIFITCICVPAVVAIGLLLGDVNFYITSVVIIFLIMLPFFMRFEGRNPQARELVVIAVMTAIAAASRAAFVWLPSFSPLIGIAIITAIALGPEQGFITGALAAFVSNFLFGQGPWTPWQMFAYGIGAFIAGILVKKGILKPTRVPLTIFGFLIIVLFVGPILDTCTVFVITPGTLESALSIYLAGFVYNIGHGLATAITLALVSKPLCEKIERIRVKYGMAED